MRRILFVVVAAVVVMKVASSDAKHAPPMRVATRVTSVQPPPPPPPVLTVEEDAAEEPDAPVLDVDPDVDEDTGEGIDLDVALENARVATSPNGAIQGVVRDNRNGESIPGVTVIVSSPALQGVQVAITDDAGAFHLAELPSGNYLVTLYYLDTTVEYSGIAILSGRTTPFFHAIATDTRPIVMEDQGEGITIDVEYTKNIPVPGRTFESTLGALHDEGISFSGEESLHNTYIVDEQPIDPCAVIE